MTSGVIMLMIPITLANDTWSFNLPTRTWTRCATSAGPSPRFGHAAAVMESWAYGPVMVVFGGLGASAVLNETWMLSLTTWVWTQLRPAAVPQV